MVLSPIPSATVSAPGFEPLPQRLPVLLVGHGSRDADGRQALLDLAIAYQELDPERPVIPCFLELTEPTIAAGVAECDRLGYRDVVALPVLLFGARHNKFDVTNELDALQRQYPHMVFHYGAPLGITSDILDLLRQRLADIERQLSPEIDRSDTVVLFVGRGSSDPEANSEACKLARLLWEGSGYRSIEVCFVGITHPRLEAGFDRALLLQPRRILVLPYFLFTGMLVKKIQATTAARRLAQPELEIVCLPEMGIVPEVLDALHQREREAIAGEIRMNCQLCKFRIAASQTLGPTHSHEHAIHHGHSHSGEHAHSHGHSHHDEHSHDGEGVTPDPYATESDYHQRVWQVP